MNKIVMGISLLVAFSFNGYTQFKIIATNTGAAYSGPSVPAANHEPIKAFDNDDATSWEIIGSSPQYISKVLDKAYKIRKIELKWSGYNFATGLTVTASNDWSTWTPIATKFNIGENITTLDIPETVTTAYSLIQINFTGRAVEGTGYTLLSCKIYEPDPNYVAPGAGGSYWAASNNDIRNTNSGIVYVGTGAPTNVSPDANLKLSVNGGIYAQKLTVTNSWSDYVFKPGYQLRTLTEVEKFIVANKHLPDVPSEKQIAEQGVSVGENQAILLRKIEELTLYIIEQNKKLRQLQKKVNNQGRQLKKLQGSQ